MSCNSCNYKGYLETVFYHSNREFESLEMCPICKDDTAYNREVQIRMKKIEEMKKEIAEETKNVIWFDFNARRRMANPFLYS